MKKKFQDVGAVIKNLPNFYTEKEIKQAGSIGALCENNKKTFEESIKSFKKSHLI
jgi:hypothetical protein